MSVRLALHRCYDGLDRLTGAERGVTGPTGVFAAATGSKAWTLDELGNWQNVTKDPGQATESAEPRQHTATNQIRSIGEVGSQLFRFYDPNGNLVLVTADPTGRWRARRARGCGTTRGTGWWGSTSWGCRRSGRRGSTPTTA